MNGLFRRRKKNGNIKRFMDVKQTDCDKILCQRVLLGTI